MIHVSPMPEVVGSFDVQTATAVSERLMPRFLGKNVPCKKRLRDTEKTKNLLNEIRLEHSIDPSRLQPPLLFYGRTASHQKDISREPHIDGVMSSLLEHTVVKPGAQLNGVSCVPTVYLVGEADFEESTPIMDDDYEEYCRESPLLSNGVLIDSYIGQRDIRTAKKAGALREVRFKPGEVVHVPGNTLHYTDTMPLSVEVPEHRLFYGQPFLVTKN